MGYLGGHEHLYGPAVARCLQALWSELEPRLDRILDDFLRNQLRVPDVGQLLDSFSERQHRQLRQRQRRILRILVSPGLNDARHRALACRVGRFRAIAGAGSLEHAACQEGVLAAVHAHVDVPGHAMALTVLGSRLLRDSALQMQACRQLEQERKALLDDVRRMVWQVKGYADLISRVSLRLGSYPEIQAVIFGRQDPQGIFRYEAMDGRNPVDVSVDRTVIHEASESLTCLAWHSGEIQRCINIATDPAMEPWRDLLPDWNIHSLASIPLHAPNGTLTTVMTLASSFPGGYSGAGRLQFIEALKSLLEFALARIERHEGHTPTVPAMQRQRWRSLLRTEALQMHYQPQLELRTGRVCKVEALARLRDGERLLGWEEFLPVLSSDDFVEVYARGLQQALRQRQGWLREGCELAVAVNLPPNALSEPRYYDITRQALHETGTEPQALTLELLETGDAVSGADHRGELLRYRQLGVELAEDDLGAGYSSLKRLREMPFDAIKIDRSIVRRTERDINAVLHLLYQLTRLGHSLGKTVIVEGVEEEGLLEAVTLLGVDVVQGYVVAKAMPGDALAGWLRGYRPPALPDRRAPRSRPAKLARLLVWEEHLRLLLQEAWPEHSPAAQLPFAQIDAQAQRDLLQAAMEHCITSAEYGNARQALLRSLLESPA